VAGKRGPSGQEVNRERDESQPRTHAPEAPDGVCVYGCDAANGSYYQLYTDDRNVCRVYQMSIGNGEWKLWREGEPFNQRFTATISEDGNKIEGRWEYDEGDGWKTDFDLVCTG